MSEGYGPDLERDAGPGLLSYLPSIMWQRRWWIIVPLILCSVAGIVAALFLPPRYQSSATLLVESPQLPTEIVGNAPETSIIDRRIAKVREQVLSRSGLVELIETNNLYSEERQKKPLSEIVDQMRKATSISPVAADIGGGDKGSNTIAFSISFSYNDPQKAQSVAQEFVHRLVKIDTSQIAEQAAGSVEFLQEQANSLSGQITDIETQIQGIKRANGSALANSGMMMMPSSGGYQSQIAGLQRENAQLAAQARLQSTAAERDSAVVGAEAQLAAARAVYSDNHPDVKLAEARLIEAKRFAAQNVKRNDVSSEVQRQIVSNNAAISSLSATQISEQSRAGAVLSAQSRAPAVNEQVAQLQARADGLRTNYQTIATNLINARGSAKLSEQQKGERLTVIDPPVIADRPTWPNRPLVMLGGLAAGAVLGLGLAMLVELLLQPIRGVNALTELFGAPPLVIVPTLKVTKNRFVWPWRRRRKVLSGAAGDRDGML